MSKARALALLVALSLASTVFIATPAQAGKWRWHFCRFQSADGHKGFADWEVRRTIRCATQKFGVSFKTAMCIARRESGLNEFADNPYSTASGVFQVVEGTWDGWATQFHRKWVHWRAWRRGSVWHARTNVMRSVFVMHRHGLSAWGGGC